VARPCKTLGDVESAYRLVYKEYLARGYCTQNPSQMHYNFYCILPDSRTFVIEKSGVIVGTVSLFCDSPCGLPLESLYPTEVAKFRVEGRRLAEVGLLALDSRIFHRNCFSLTEVRKMSALFRLFKLLLDYSCSSNVTDLLIAVHPKHQALYEYMKFEPFGEVKSYAVACGNPALPMRGDIPMAIRTAPKRGGLSVFHGKPIYTEKTFENHFDWSEELSRDFLFRRLPLWQQLPTKARNHMSYCLGLEMTDDCTSNICATPSSFKPRRH